VYVAELLQAEAQEPPGPPVGVGLEVVGGGVVPPPGAPPVKAWKIYVNWPVLWVRPLHEELAVVSPEQPPLSRPSDQNEVHARPCCAA